MHEQIKTENILMNLSTLCTLIEADKKEEALGLIEDIKQKVLRIDNNTMPHRRVFF